MTSQSGDQRRRNSAESRDLLLGAAAELFGEKGYEKTTLREIAARAGVDAALIARYFGSKAKLYLATLQLEGRTLDAIDVRDPARLRRLLDRVREMGSGPSLWAAVRPHEDEDLQTAAVEMLDRRFLVPGREVAEGAGLDLGQLRAEIVTAALAGVVMSRSSGTFRTLNEASSQDVARLTAQMLAELLGPAVGPD